MIITSQFPSSKNNFQAVEINTSGRFVPMHVHITCRGEKVNRFELLAPKCLYNTVLLACSRINHGMLIRKATSHTLRDFLPNNVILHVESTDSKGTNIECLSHLHTTPYYLPPILKSVGPLSFLASLLFVSLLLLPTLLSNHIT